MSETPVPLSPDEEPQTGIQLPGKGTAVPQPYELTAVMAGLLLLLLFRTRIHPGMQLLTLAVFGIVAAYLLLAAYRPKLPPYLLSVIAAELGLFYSFPATLVYHPFHLGFSMLDRLFALWSIFFALIIGVLFGYWLKIEEHPNSVILVNFLVMFVLYGIFTLR